jgi:REP element-mobilizing transposase RayT
MEVLIMTRTLREISPTGAYHVMVRGINKQAIFMADFEKSEYLRRLRVIRNENPIRIFAYCIMDNHAHLLIDEGENTGLLSRCMLSVNCGYAGWYNRRRKRLGPLFQERYRSEVIRDNAHLLAVARYIHQNPVRIGRSIRYWTSHDDYLRGDGITDTELILSLFASDVSLARECFAAFMETDERAESAEPHLEHSERERESRSASAVIDGILGSGQAKKLIRLDLPRRNERLKKLKGAGLSLRQIEIATGISKSVIARL